jgi:type I restriction enzyme M protein
MDLIPPSLIVSRYLADEQARVDELAATAEEATRGLEAYLDEHAVEDGLLAEAMDDDKISKVLVAARLRIAKRDKTDPDELKALEHAIKLYDAEAAAKKAVKEAQAELDLATLKQYVNLTEPDVKRLVLDDKWTITVVTRVVAVVEGLSLTLVARLRQLGERYAETLASIEADIDAVEELVRAHLAVMGIES